LYLPGCWLKNGKNTIAVFEQLNGVKQTETEISGVKVPVLDQLKK
jgi:beta-galactosidase